MASKMPASFPPVLAINTGPTKRACDACHRRKVKCIPSDNSRQCKNCSHASLKCTYNSIPLKKGPKGCRAKVISELRETQRFTVPANPIYSPPASPLTVRPLPPELIEACTTFFFDNVYPTQPILKPALLQQTIATMHQSLEAHCLISSLVAYMLIQPNMTTLPPGLDLSPGADTTTISLGTSILSETIDLRKSFAYFENATTMSVATSFFLFGSMFCLERHNTAWFHLREATTLALIMGMHEESTYETGDAVENMLKRRLFWLLYVTERAYALQQSKPLTLHATITPPRVDDDASETTELCGFLHLIQLFKPFDDTFVGLWNQSLQQCSAQWIVSLQEQLTDALPRYLKCTETQAVDLRTSQQWLKTMVWQLSIRHSMLSSSATDESLTFNYPVELSRAMVVEASNFSRSAAEVHGIGLIKKLFDISDTLVDVMAFVRPADNGCFQVGPQDYLNQFISLMSSLRGGSDRYLPMLLNKIQESLPQMIPRSPSSTLMLGPSRSSYDSYSTGLEVSTVDTQDSLNGTDSPFHSPLSSAALKSEFGELVETPQMIPLADSCYINSVPTSESLSLGTPLYSG